MFRVKICGIRSAEDARAVAEAGGNAIGFNFYPGTRRYIEPDEAAAIASQLPPTVQRVGVFVNAPVAQIAEISNTVGLDAIQLHGDEPAEVLGQLPKKMRVVRALRLTSADWAGVDDFLQRCLAAGRLPDALLVDAHVPGSYGGTGEALDWLALDRAERRVADSPLAGIPLILAGGLTEHNVTQAINQARPDGVDVASGVESSPGIKDPGKVERFVAAARTALSTLRSV